MPHVDESKVFNALLSLRGGGAIPLGNQELLVEVEPIDNHSGDSPDFLLWVKLTFHIFGQQVLIRVPVPVEAEKGGIDGGAMDDLAKFLERRRHMMKLPMLVVAESGYDERTQDCDIPTEITILQVPMRALD